MSKGKGRTKEWIFEYKSDNPPQAKTEEIALAMTLVARYEG